MGGSLCVCPYNTAYLCQKWIDFPPACLPTVSQCVMCRQPGLVLSEASLEMTGKRQQGNLTSKTVLNLSAALNVQNTTRDGCYNSHFCLLDLTLFTSLRYISIPFACLIRGYNICWRHVGCFKRPLLKIGVLNNPLIGAKLIRCYRLWQRLWWITGDIDSGGKTLLLENAAFSRN